MNEWYYDSNNSDSNLAKRNCKNTRNECCTRLFVCWICQKYTPPQCPTNVCVPTDFIKLEQKRVNRSKNEQKREGERHPHKHKKKSTYPYTEEENEREKPLWITNDACFVLHYILSILIFWENVSAFMQSIFRRIVLSCRIIFITISMFILWRC